MLTIKIPFFDKKCFLTRKKASSKCFCTSIIRFISKLCFYACYYIKIILLLTPFLSKRYELFYVISVAIIIVLLPNYGIKKTIRKLFIFISRIWKREADNEKDEKGIIKKIKDEVDHEVDVVADKTGMKGWQVLAIFVIIVLAVVGLVGWCIWRFFKKKRKGKDGKGKDIPPDTADDKDDLQALVANAEEDLNPEDKKGKIENKKATLTSNNII